MVRGKDKYIPPEGYRIGRIPQFLKKIEDALRKTYGEGIGPFHDGGEQVEKGHPEILLHWYERELHTERCNDPGFDHLNFGLFFVWVRTERRASDRRLKGIRVNVGYRNATPEDIEKVGKAIECVGLVRKL